MASPFHASTTATHGTPGAGTGTGALKHRRSTGMISATLLSSSPLPPASPASSLPLPFVSPAHAHAHAHALNATVVGRRVSGAFADLGQQQPQPYPHQPQPHPHQQPYQQVHMHEPYQQQQQHQPGYEQNQFQVPPQQHDEQPAQQPAAQPQPPRAGAGMGILPIIMMAVAAILIGFGAFAYFGQPPPFCDSAPPPLLLSGGQSRMFLLVLTFYAFQSMNVICILALTFLAPIVGSAEKSTVLIVFLLPLDPFPFADTAASATPCRVCPHNDQTARVAACVGGNLVCLTPLTDAPQPWYRAPMAMGSGTSGGGSGSDTSAFEGFGRCVRSQELVDETAHRLAETAIDEIEVQVPKCAVKIRWRRMGEYSLYLHANTRS